MRKEHTRTHTSERSYVWNVVVSSHQPATGSAREQVEARIMMVKKVVVAVISELMPEGIYGMF